MKSADQASSLMHLAVSHTHFKVDVSTR
uniref:Uncharacterized protein n=1 Tax=Anguilla anguilla TaxID=7936 RepID=A0A0E9TMP0_ANGAN